MFYERAVRRLDFSKATSGLSSVSTLPLATRGGTTLKRYEYHVPSHCFVTDANTAIISTIGVESQTGVLAFICMVFNHLLVVRHRGPY